MTTWTHTMLLVEIPMGVGRKGAVHFLPLSGSLSKDTGIPSRLDAEDDRPEKRKVPTRSKTFYSRPEDEVSHRHAVSRSL
jgi:hypothetical protein